MLFENEDKENATKLTTNYKS